MNIRIGASAVILSAMLPLTGCAGPGANPVVSSGDEFGGGPSSPRDGDDSSQQHDSNPSASTDDATPRGFQFESGFLEFGEFDPYTLGDDIFNPCTEITEEEFAEAGFEGMWFEDDGTDPLGRGMASCFFAGDLPDGVIHGFLNSQLNRSIAAEHDLVVREYTSLLLPQLYAVAPRGENEGMCFIQVDTVRGSFGTQAGGSPKRTTTDDACKLAIEDLETLYEHFGR